METVYKTYRATVKEVDDSTGEIEMMIPISSNQIDRDGEIIDPDAFKKTLSKFMKHPVLVASHDYRDLTNQIGEWTKLKVEVDGLSGKPKYYINAGNEQADWAYYLASKGVAAFSVGFIPKVWEDGKDEKSPRRTYKEVELLEISQVIIPSNRQAVQSMRSKSVDPVITELCDEVEKELVTKPEETDEFIRIPVRECKVTATIDISKREGISALYCGEEKQVRTYLFRKDHEWTLEKAKAWVKEHAGKTFDPEEGIEIEHPEPKAVSQKEIMDEIDYLKSMIEKVGLSEHVADALNALGDGKVKVNMSQMRKMHAMMVDMGEMANKAREMSEDMMGEMEDMDDEKQVKAGAVLNKRNKDRLNQIKQLAQEVLNSAGVEDNDEEKRLHESDNSFEKNNIDGPFSVEDILETVQGIKL